jgi:hypothetical protein
MGWSTSVVPTRWRHGRLHGLAAKALRPQDRVYYPAHGDPIANPHQFVRGMLGHRRQRERQILRAGNRALPIPAMVAQMYKGWTRAWSGRRAARCWPTCSIWNARAGSVVGRTNGRQQADFAGPIPSGRIPPSATRPAQCSRGCCSSARWRWPACLPGCCGTAQDIGDPLATSLVAFERQNSLTVFSAELAPVVSSDDSRLFGLVQSKQVAVIPARIDYTIDLSQMNRDRMAWNAQTQTLSVRLPPLRLSRPNLDEARAQYLREGVWITRAAQDKLTRDNTRLAEQLATQQAANPVLMGLARNAAKDAVRQNLAIPLQVAGFGKVTVNVTIDGESTADIGR